ncbi:hypothetical protein QBC42DRAFT_249971 [Cladorrhinum samala]|uniref:GS catalytic domain-containing protein n=1 Tax=Cladorrhinum samala TaxID=585594 RepID=A0AAV9HYE0_9PEZI|nr:hypothetical protein QBC42DRAFT_249971 [Cladorrhinum samala]
MEHDVASIPDDRDQTPLEDFLDCNPNVKFVECIWVDYFGITRMRKMTTSRAVELASSRNGYLTLNPSSMANHLEGAPIPDLSNPGVDRMRPDWSSLRLMGDDATRAAVICWYMGKEILTRHPLPAGLLQPQPPCEDEGSPGRCPRTALKKMLRIGQAAHSAHFRIGFELEFYLLEEAYDPAEPGDDHGDDEAQHDRAAAPSKPSKKDRGHSDPRTYWNTASSLRGRAGACLEACVSSLEACGIPVEHFHSNGGGGGGGGDNGAQKYKISLSHQPPIPAADSLILSMEIIKRVAISHNLYATFFPKPFPDTSSSNNNNNSNNTTTTTPVTAISRLHTHISIHGVPDSSCSSFLAGTLHRLPLLTALSLPHITSYHPHNPSGGWVSWGTENRSTAIRQISPSHWETRIPDCASNIYLALSIFLAAGILGIRDKTPLLWEDCRANVGAMNGFERLESGINTRLPDGLDASLKIINGGFQGLEQVLGAGILEYYRALRRADRDHGARVGRRAVECFLAKEF